MHRIKKYPIINQHDERDCGAACLAMIAEYYGRKLKLERCRSIIKVGLDGSSMYNIILGANLVGLRAEAYESSLADLIDEVQAGNICFPLIVRVISEEKYEHFVVLYSMEEKNIVLGDPAKGEISRLSLLQFEQVWLGQLITFDKKEDFVCEDEREYNLLKYFKEIKTMKIDMVLVFLGAILIMLINISGAYLFRFIISNSYNVFYVLGHIVTDGIEKICLILMLLYCFRICVENVRCKILTNITRRIDVSITMGYYNHLIRMKTEVFDTRQTGDFISRFYDTVDIREAVSSVFFSAVLDGGVAVVSAVILYKIDLRMFVCSLITIMLYALVILRYKGKIKVLKNNIMTAEAKVMSFLKESIDGIQTIKAFNYESVYYEKFSKLLKLPTPKWCKNAL